MLSEDVGTAAEADEEVVPLDVALSSCSAEAAKKVFEHAKLAHADSGSAWGEDDEQREYILKITKVVSGEFLGGETASLNGVGMDVPSSSSSSRGGGALPGNLPGEDREDEFDRSSNLEASGALEGTSAKTQFYTRFHSRTQFHEETEFMRGVSERELACLPQGGADYTDCLRGSAGTLTTSAGRTPGGYHLHNSSLGSPLGSLVCESGAASARRSASVEQNASVNIPPGVNIPPPEFLVLPAEEGCGPPPAEADAGVPWSSSISQEELVVPPAVPPAIPLVPPNGSLSPLNGSLDELSSALHFSGRAATTAPAGFTAVFKQGDSSDSLSTDSPDIEVIRGPATVGHGFYSSAPPPPPRSTTSSRHGCNEGAVHNTSTGFSEHSTRAPNSTFLGLQDPRRGTVGSASSSSKLYDNFSSPELEISTEGGFFGAPPSYTYGGSSGSTHSPTFKQQQHDEDNFPPARGRTRTLDQQSDSSSARKARRTRIKATRAGTRAKQGGSSSGGSASDSSPSVMFSTQPLAARLPTGAVEDIGASVSPLKISGQGLLHDMCSSGEEVVEDSAGGAQGRNRRENGGPSSRPSPSSSSHGTSSSVKTVLDGGSLFGDPIRLELSQHSNQDYISVASILRESHTKLILSQKDPYAYAEEGSPSTQEVEVEVEEDGSSPGLVERVSLPVRADLDDSERDRSSGGPPSSWNNTETSGRGAGGSSGAASVSMGGTEVSENHGVNPLDLLDASFSSGGGRGSTTSQAAGREVGEEQSCRASSKTAVKTVLRGAVAEVRGLPGGGGTSRSGVVNSPPVTDVHDRRHVDGPLTRMMDHLDHGEQQQEQDGERKKQAVSPVEAAISSTPDGVISATGRPPGEYYHRMLGGHGGAVELFAQVVEDDEAPVEFHMEGNLGAPPTLVGLPGQATLGRPETVAKADEEVFAPFDSDLHFATMNDGCEQLTSFVDGGEELNERQSSSAPFQQTNLVPADALTSRGPSSHEHAEAPNPENGGAGEEDSPEDAAGAGSSRGTFVRNPDDHDSVHSDQYLPSPRKFPPLISPVKNRFELGVLKQNHSIAPSSCTNSPDETLVQTKSPEAAFMAKLMTTMDEITAAANLASIRIEGEEEEDSFKDNYLEAEEGASLGPGRGGAAAGEGAGRGPRRRHTSTKSATTNEKNHTSSSKGAEKGDKKKRKKRRRSSSSGKPPVVADPAPHTTNGHGVDCPMQDQGSSTATQQVCSADPRLLREESREESWVRGADLPETETTQETSTSEVPAKSSLPETSTQEHSDHSFGTALLHQTTSNVRESGGFRDASRALPRTHTSSSTGNNSAHSDTLSLSKTGSSSSASKTSDELSSSVTSSSKKPLSASLSSKLSSHVSESSVRSDNSRASRRTQWKSTNVVPTASVLLEQC